MRSFDVAGSSIIGLNPDRTTNEDAYGYVIGESANDDGSRSWGVFCLADGLGGMEAGEVASRTAVRAVLGYGCAGLGDGGAPMPEDGRGASPAEWIQAANTEVCKALSRCDARGGTTCIAVAILNQTVTVGHVGDSRLYLMRSGEARLLTQDHSLAMLQVLQGGIALGDVRHHPDRNSLTRTLGERTPLPSYQIDTLATTTERTDLTLHADDVLVLCSDGVWELVEEPELTEALLDEDRPLAAAARRIMSLVLDRKAPDNATILMIRHTMIDGPESSSQRAGQRTGTPPDAAGDRQKWTRKRTRA